MGNAVSSEAQGRDGSPVQQTLASLGLSAIEEEGDGAGDGSPSVFADIVDLELKADIIMEEKMDCDSRPSDSPIEDQDNGILGSLNAKECTSVQKKRSSTGSSQTGSAASTTPEIRTSRTTPRASSSFDERFKNKVSIYSKVSGCRMTNLPDYTIVKQVRVVILQHITKGNPQGVLAVKFAYEKMKNGGLQIITDDIRLSNALSSLSYFASIPCKMTFPNNPRVVGFVKNLPIDMEPAELKQEIRKELPEVYSVRYITERAAGRSRPSQGPCAFISFNLRYLPGSVWVYGKEYEIQVPNPMQCTRCCRYGHQGKQCRAEVKCPLCTSQHPKHQCGSSILRCVNCKGAHSSTSHECSVWQQGKFMNELRYRGGMTAEEAIDVASKGKIQHKKHSFIAPDEYFENLETLYLGDGDGSHGSDEETANAATINRTTVNADENETVMDSPRKFFHPKYVETQEFLDLMTDFYLRLTNPDENYTSTILMPGFEDDSMMQRLNKTGHKKPSLVAEQFKICVLRAMEIDEEKDEVEISLNA